MKIFFALMLLSLTFHTRAEMFRMAGREVTFEMKDGVLVHGCEKKCDALTVIKKHSKIKLKDLQGNKLSSSLGSLVCEKIYRRGSILGVAENRDQRAFCHFKDNSLVEINSLSSYLVEKKILPPQ